MSGKKTVFRAAGALMALLFSLLLSGCGGKPLVEREIVRAMFFLPHAGGCQAVLLLQDQESEKPTAYTTASGTGKTAARALADAVQGLPGTPFYGVMDLAVMPADSNWEQLQAMVDLIRDTAQPSPEVSLYLIEDADAALLPDQAGQMYDAIQQCEKRYHLQCGLETLGQQEGCAAIPVYGGLPYGFTLQTSDDTRRQYQEPVDAQLAAVLCGQTDRLDMMFGDGAYSCQAAARTICQADPERLNVRLILSDTRLAALHEESESSETEAISAALTYALQQAFARLCADAENMQVDPYRFRFWETGLLGSGAPPLPVTLQVEFA